MSTFTWRKENKQSAVPLGTWGPERHCLPRQRMTLGHGRTWSSGELGTWRGTSSVCGNSGKASEKHGWKMSRMEAGKKLCESKAWSGRWKKFSTTGRSQQREDKDSNKREEEEVRRSDHKSSLDQHLS